MQRGQGGKETDRLYSNRHYRYGHQHTSQTHAHDSMSQQSRRV